MTTDTHAKSVASEIEIGDIPVRIGGIAKGSGMIAPNMATMLSYQIAVEAREAYGGYPRWATNSFGWGLCVVTPLSLACVGAARPLDVGRKFCHVGGAGARFAGSYSYSLGVSDEGVGVRTTRVTDGIRTLERGEVEMGPSGI